MNPTRMCAAVPGKAFEIGRSGWTRDFAMNSPRSFERPVTPTTSSFTIASEAIEESAGRRTLTESVSSSISKMRWPFFVVRASVTIPMIAVSRVSFFARDISIAPESSGRERRRREIVANRCRKYRPKSARVPSHVEWPVMSFRIRTSSATSEAGATVSRKDGRIDPGGTGALGAAGGSRKARSDAARAIPTARRMSSKVITKGGSGNARRTRSAAPRGSACVRRYSTACSSARVPLSLKKSRTRSRILRAHGESRDI